MTEQLNACLRCVRGKTDFQPKVGIVLGSGLGGFADEIDCKAVVNYKEIEGFPVSTVEGHKGRFVFGFVENVPVVIMQGRVHYYEGYSMQEVVLPVRLMGLMGISRLILTNASGGVNEKFHAGDLMILTDHITTAVPSPLIGKNLDELGPRFPDMTEVYSKRLQSLIREAADEAGIPIQEGVYVQFTGPNYETPAEIRLARSWGGDAVGMSTACEAMAAKHMGLEICGISCVTNMAAGISPEPLSHEEVQKSADLASANFKKLIRGMVKKMG